jgi:3-hydroxyacyl-CoA dehydrogenase
VSDPPEVIGVVGAGTMGAGIVQLAAATGARTLLHDPVADALARGVRQVEDGLGRWREKGRLEREPGAVEGVAQLEGLELGEERYRAAPLLRRMATYHGPGA